MSMWSGMRNWNLVLPPSRPSARELKYVTEVARDVSRESRVAVLGSTPEFRDLLYEIGFGDICVLEQDLTFLESVSALRIYNNRESLIHGDWLDTLGDCHGEFSLMLSDLTMGNVPYERREEFYGLIAGALRDGGVLYDKVLTHSERGRDVGGLIAKYRELPLNLVHVNEFSCEMVFCSDLIIEAGVVDTNDVYDAVKARDGGPRIEAFLEACELITPRGCCWYYGRPWDTVSRTYCRELVEVAAADDEDGSPYRGLLKLFVMKRARL